MTCYKTISLQNIMSEWWNSIHVDLRGLSEQSGAGASPVSDTKPFSKLMGFQNKINSYVPSRFMTVFFDKLLELKVAHDVAFFALRCVSKKNNPHTSLLI